MLNYRDLTKSEYAKAASEYGNVRVIGVGNIRVRKIIDGHETVITLMDVGFAPKCRTNLVSLVKAQKAGAEIHLKPGVTRMVRQLWLVTVRILG